MLDHRFVRHRSALSIVRAFFHGRPGDFRHPLDERSHTRDEWLAEVRRHRHWAFVRIRPDEQAEINWYAADDVPADQVAHMLGHELGHIAAENVEDDEEEELRADEYGWVARIVMAKLRPSAAGSGPRTRTRRATGRPPRRRRR